MRPRWGRGPRSISGTSSPSNRTVVVSRMDSFMQIEHLFLRRAASILLLVLPAACTMKDQEAPAFTGPSEFGKSINITLTPDAIVQDGTSQSVVTVSAFDAGGEPLANMA